MSVLRAALYLYASKRGHGKHGCELDAQRATCSTYITARAWQLIGEYIDLDDNSSTDDTARPELQRALDAAAAGTFHVLVVASLSCLAHTAHTVLTLIDTLTRLGVAFVACREAFDTGTPHGRAAVPLVSALVQLEQATRRVATTGGEHAAHRANRRRRGQIPYGYHRVERVEIIPHEAQIVRRIFRLRQQGLTLRAIAADLQPYGPSPRGTRWSATAVKRILDAEAVYLGRHPEDRLERWPAILRKQASARTAKDAASCS